MGALAARARARARLKGSAQPILFHQVLVGFLDSLQSFHSRIESRLMETWSRSVNARWQMPQAPSRGQDAPIGPWPATGCVVCLVTDPWPECAKKRGQGPPLLRLVLAAGVSIFTTTTKCRSSRRDIDRRLVSSSHAARVARIGMLACARARPLVARSRPAPRAARRAARCAGSRQGKKAEVRSKIFLVR